MSGRSFARRVSSSLALCVFEERGMLKLPGRVIHNGVILCIDGVQFWGNSSSRTISTLLSPVHGTPLNPCPHPYVPMVGRACQVVLIQPLLVAVKTMHASFLLRSWGTDFESELVVIQSVLCFSDAFDAGILEAMSNALHQVRDVSLQCSLICHCATHALGDLHCGGFRVPHVTLLASLVHRLEAAHSTVSLQADAVLVEVLAWGLVRAGQHATHHNASCSEA
mmetsp:Transcript_23011/g.64125  ORF Transcript_23011/g.64125 Transcript_23011/m.64125 type:complete len:223 (+) Transcript_23011:194-862(+)